MRLAVALLTAALAIGGCRRGAGQARSHADIPRTQLATVRFAQRELNCAQVERIVPVSATVVQVRGCGQRREYLTIPGRAPIAITPVESLAVVDLRCRPALLSIESPAPAVRAVAGCERRARYDLLCAHGRCDWIMTSHTGLWAGLAPPPPVDPLPPQFDVGWALPPGVDPDAYARPPEEAVDLDTVALPPPPDAVIPPPPAPPSPP